MGAALDGRMRNRSKRSCIGPWLVLNPSRVGVRGAGVSAQLDRLVKNEHLILTMQGNRIVLVAGASALRVGPLLQSTRQVKTTLHTRYPKTGPCAHIVSPTSAEPRKPETPDPP